MDEMTIIVRGLEEVSETNRKIAQQISESGNLVAKAALVIEKQAKVNASGRPGPNVQTGRLRASITTQIDSPIRAVVGTNVKYAPHVEYGHSQEVGRFVPIYNMRKITGGQFKGRYEVSRGLGVRLVNPRAPAYPFMGPTISQTKDQMKGVMVSFGEDLKGDLVRMSVQLFRDELKTTLETMGGLTVYKEWPSVIIPPYAVIYLSPDNPITYHQPAKGNITYHFMVELGVMKAATIEASQEALDPFLEPTGTTSVYYALANTTYTHVDVIDVSDVVNYGEVVYSGSQFYGARLKLDAWKSGL